jgi:DNA invertase Pin-like site-specific DNA recombinase
MIHGYGRVSSKQQDYALQVEALKAAGCERIHAEKASGKSTDGRPELKRLIKSLKPGGGLAELERSLILARTEAGIAKAREQGKQFGRPERLDAGQKRKIANRIAKGDASMADLAAEYGVGVAKRSGGPFNPKSPRRKKRTPQVPR